MSSTSPRLGLSTTQFLKKGINKLRSTKALTAVVLSMLLLTAVVSTRALAANSDQTYFGQVTASISGFLGLGTGTKAVEPLADGRGGDKSGAGKSACDSAPEGLLACYRADLDATDSTGQHDGQWVGVTGYTNAKTGQGAFQFNGSSRVTVPNAADLNPAAVTVAGWVNIASTDDATFALLSKGDAYSLQVRNGGLFFVSKNADGTTEELDAGKAVKAGEWTHIAATHDGTTVRIYVNGEEAVKATQAGLFTGDGGELVIGAAVAKADGFSAAADDVELFGRALSAEEIKKISSPNAPSDITSFTITPGQISEVLGGSQVTLTVVRSAPAANAISVNFTPSGGTATAGTSCGIPGTDYVLGQNSVSYVAGETGPKSFTIDICDDLVGENTETASITAAIVGSGETIAGNPASFTIFDNDTVSLSSFPLGALTEGTGAGADGAGGTPGQTLIQYITNGNTGTYTFQMTGTAQFAATTATSAQDYTLTNVAGAAGCDTFTFDPVTGTGTIGEASASCSIAFATVTDDYVETNETAIMSIAAPNAPPGGVTQTTTINNDDDPWISVTVAGSGLSNTNQAFAEEGTTGGSAGGVLNYSFTRGLCAAASPGTPGGVGQATCRGGDTAGLGFQTININSTGTATSGTDYAAVPSFNIGSGSTLALVSVNPTDDNLVEADETITFTTTDNIQNNGTGYHADNTPAGSNTATGWINDDDVDVTVTGAVPATVSEAGPGGLTYTVARSANSVGITSAFLFPGNPVNPLNGDLVANFTMSGTATCTPGGDYTVTGGDPLNAVVYPTAGCNGTIAFLNGGIFGGDGDLSGTVVVTPINDAIPEPNETAILTIIPGNTNPNLYHVGTSAANANTTATGTILNDDCQVRLTESTASGNGNEGNPGAGSSFNFTFTTRGDGCTGNIVNFTASGTATPGTVSPADYTVTGAGVTFNPANGQGTVAITGAPTVVGGIEERSQNVVVTTIPDTTVEPNEEVQIQVDAYTGNGTAYQQGSPAQQSALIVNDDSQSVEVAIIGASSVNEGNLAPAATAPGSITYRFTRTNSDGLPLSVTYDINTAAPLPTNPADNADFVHPPNIGNNLVQFIGANTTVDVVVTTVADNTVEPDESVKVTVLSGTGYTAGVNSSATGTILNDDTTITCTGGSSVLEATPPAAGNQITFTCTRAGNGASGAGALAIPFTLGGTATPGTDYTVGGNAAGTTLTFPGGNNTASVVITTVPDATPEPDETVTVTFTGGNAGGQGFYLTPDPTTLTGTILNDDQTVAVQYVTPISKTTVENSGVPLVARFTRNIGSTVPPPPANNLAGQVDVTFTVGAVPPAGVGVADCVNDFTVTTSTPGALQSFNPATCTGVVRIAANALTADINIVPTADNVVEPDENAVITVVASANYTPLAGSNTDTGVILNDDTAFSVASVAGGQANEGNDNASIPHGIVPETDPTSGQTTGLTPHGSHAVFAVTRTGNLAADQTIDIATIANGFPGTGTAVLGPQNSACGAPGVDAINDGKTLTFPAGSAAVQYFFVAVCGDTTYEDNETINVQLTNPKPANPQVTVPVGTATWTIVNDDGANGLFIRPSNVSVAEGATANFQVCLFSTQSGGTPVTAGVDITFDYKTTDNTAVSPADYAALTTATGTILAGTSCSANIPVVTAVDNIFEGPETYFFDISNLHTPGVNPILPQFGPAAGTPLPGNAPGRGVGTITDPTPPNSFTISDVSQAEGNGGDSATSFIHTLRRTGKAAGPQTVCWSTQDGNAAIPGGGLNPATGGVTASGTFDYTIIPSNCFTFTSDGNAVTDVDTVPVIVVVNGDAIAENNETYTVKLTTINGAAPAAGGPFFATNPNHQGDPLYAGLGIGTIQNDDAAAQVGITTVGNGNGILETNAGTFAIPVNFQVNGAFQGTTTVTYTLTPGATNPATVGAPGTVPATIGAAAAGSCTGTVDLYAPAAGQTGASPFTITGTGAATTNAATTLIGCGDIRPELNENYTVTVTGVTGPAVIAATTTACRANTSVCGTKDGSITDNDPLGAFFFAASPTDANGDVSLLEGSQVGGKTNFDFNFTYSGTPADYPITATLQTVDGTATVADNDYTANTCTVTFAAGSQAGTPSPSCRVLVNHDTTQESDETFTVQTTAFTTPFAQVTGFTVLGNDVNGNPVLFNPATFGTAGNPAPVGTDLIAQGNILNDDGVPIMATNVISVTEGTNTPFTATPVTPFTVRVTRTGTTVLGSTVTVAVPQQSVPNGNTVLARGGASCATANNLLDGTNATIGGVAVAQPGADYIIAPATPINFFGGVGTGSGFDYIDVTFGTVGVDQPAPIQGNGQPGGANPNIVVAGGICRDQRLEGNETVQVVLAAGTNSAVNNAGGGTVTIVNDDTVAISLTQNVTANEGTDPNLVNLTNFDFTLTRTGLTSLPTTPTYTVTGIGGTTVGAACTTGVDVLATPVLIPANAFVPGDTNPANQTVRVQVCPDGLGEPDEQFLLTVTVPNSGGTAATTVTVTGTGTITNDDAAPPTNGFEGDINRAALGVPGTGDGDVTVGDQIQFQRFLSGTDCPAVGTLANGLNEQQRLDADRPSLGNGLLGAADGTAIDAYARHDASTDFNPNIAGWQPTPAGGPTNITNLGCTPTAAPEGDAARSSAVTPSAPDATRAVRLVSGSGPVNSDVFVDVEYEASASDTAAIQFSVHFDPAVASISNVSGVNLNPDITVGQGAPAGTSVNVNAAGAATGDLGIGLNFNGANTNPPTVIAIGTKRIVRLKFHVLPGAALGVSPVTFTNTVVNKGLADANAIAITTPPFTDGSITVTGARTLKFGSSSTKAGGTAIIPVSLTATGAEFGISFTANWDPTLASITGVLGTDVLVGSGLPATCTLTQNTINNQPSNLALGHLAIGISCPTGGVPAGVLELVKLKFTTKPAAVAGTLIPVTFGNTPVNTEIGDNNGNTLTVDKVNGVITVLGPTAALVSVSGRVTTPNGSGLRNATVTLTDEFGTARTVTTSSFGFYQFDQVEAGASYIMGVSSRTYRFSSRSVSVTDSITNMDFVGLE